MAGHAGHLEAAGHADHVLRRGLEQAGRDAPALFAHLHRAAHQRPAAQRHAAAAEGAEALGPGAGVTVEHRHLVGRDPQVIGHHLGERGLVALAVRARAGDGGDAARALDADRPALPAERAGLDVGDHPDAHDLAARAALRLLRRSPA